MSTRAKSAGKRIRARTPCPRHLLLLLISALGAFSIGSAIWSPASGWVAWVALMPLLIAVRSLPAGRAALTGAAWGLGILLSFLLHRNSAFPIHWPGLSIALIVAVPTAYAGVGSILTRRFGFRPVLLALGWIGAEVALRPLGLPNGLLGETQRDARLAHILVNALGYGFIGALIVFANGILLHVTARAFRFPSIGPPDHCKQDDDHVLVVARGLSPRIAHEIHVTNPRAPPRPRRWRSGRRI